MRSDGGDPTQLGPGSPIRKSPDQRLVAGSPRLIAGSHVLHRLLVPRHPPWALSNLLVRAPATPLCSSQASEGGLPAPSEPNSVPTAGNANGIPGPRLWFEVCSITEVME